ncbi:MAG: hypothetical protein HFG05_02610 [Oscillibacter sp.]|nr:hypothetical protein [Oscillibacter sp.]
MTWQTMRKRVSALALAVVLTVTLTVPPAAAEAVGDGVTPTYDEAYYATLDYYGNLLEGSVVKSYAMNGKDRLMDYGVYDGVVNLTDGSAPVSGEGTVSFTFPEGAPEHFYFEGKTKRPFEELPWTIALHYTLNGVPTRAEDLAGKQGVVEIHLDIVPNELANAYARYNYTLAATALFNQDDILSLEAPGAQIQLVGNLRTVLFLCLPGEEQHFTIRVGSNDFSFGGLTLLMMPATLAQLEEIAKLSQRKDDLEEDYRALSGSLDELLDALADIQNGLYASAKGLDQLEAARSTFSGGKETLYGGTDRLRGDLNNLADLLTPVEQRVQLLSRTVTDSKAILNEMTDATVTLQSQLADMEEALYGLERGTYDLRNVLDLAAEMEDSLLRLERALGGVHVGGGSVSTNSKAMVERVKNVRGAYDAKDTTTFLQKMLEAQGAGSAEAKAKAAGMTKLLEADKAGLPVPPEQQEALAAAKQMETLHQVKQQTGMGFQDFCGQVTKDPDTAKQMNDLWLIYSSGGSGKNRTPAKTVAPVVPTGPSSEQAETSRPPEMEAPAGEQETVETPEEAPVLEQTKEPAPEKETLDTPETPKTKDTSEDGDLESPGKGQMTARLVFNASLDGDVTSGDSGSDSGSLGGSDSGSSSGSDSGSSGGSDSGSSSGGDSDSSGGSDSGSSGGSDSGSSGGSDSGSSGGSDSDSSGESDSSSSGGEDSGSSGGNGSGTPGGSEPGTPGGGGDSSGPDSPGVPGGDPSDPGKPPENNTVGGAAVDLITDGLDSASARLDQIQSELNASLNEIKRPTASVVGDLANLCGELNTLLEDLDDAEDLMAALGASSGALRNILAEVDALRNVLNTYEPTLQEALANAGTLSASAVTTIRDTEILINDAENLARSTGRDLDAGTKQSLRGLSAALRQTAKALATTKEVKEAKNTVTQIIEDTWNEYTGDVNNILLMDATAEAVSLTDGRNPAPTSIQVLIRTQEIKTEEPETAEDSVSEKEKTTFWGRIAQMFRDFWNTATSIFH